MSLTLLRQMFIKILYMYPHKQIYMLRYMSVQTVCGNMSFKNYLREQASKTGRALLPSFNQEANIMTFLNMCFHSELHTFKSGNTKGKYISIHVQFILRK